MTKLQRGLLFFLLLASLLVRTDLAPWTSPRPRGRGKKNEHAEMEEEGRTAPGKGTRPPTSVESIA